MRLVGAMLALGVQCCLTASVLAEAGMAPSTVTIDQLIAQLGSGQFAEREEAALALETVGGPALDALRRAAQSQDLEVRRRAEELAARIEVRVDSTRLLAGKKVRLGYRDTPITEAMADFSRRTGLNLKLHSDDERLAELDSRKLTLETGDLGIWDALDRFCAASGLAESSLSPDGGESLTCRLRLGEPARVPGYQAGAVRIRSLSQRSPGWGRTPGVVDAACMLEVATEPGLVWHGVADIRVHKAIDDQGQQLDQVPGSLDGGSLDELTPFGGFGKRMFRTEFADYGSQAGKQAVSVKLKLGKEASHTIKELHGTLVGQMQTPLEPLLIVDNILQNGGQGFKAGDGSTVKVGPIERDKDGRLHFDIDYQNAPTEDLLQLAFGMNNRRAMNQALIWQLRARDRMGSMPNLELRDAAGKLVEVARYNEVSQVAGTKATYSATFHILPRPGVGDPVRLQLLGRRTAIVEVPFVLKDVPLP
ncbi:MAG: hypothetical protein JNM56_14235 [Planctomycetia bacterium]|nr:hypothetical protein [Planctomycetia bacterium]